MRLSDFGELRPEGSGGSYSGPGWGLGGLRGRSDPVLPRGSI